MARYEKKPTQQDRIGLIRLVFAVIMILSGLGTLLFILIGGVLMAGGILLVMPKKKRAN